MDGWGIAIFVIGLVLYYLTKKKNVVWVFVSGIGAGVFIGALWAYQIFSNVQP